MSKKSGRYLWDTGTPSRHMQMCIGRFVNAAKRIYTEHPDVEDDLVEMIKMYGDVFDDMLNAFGSDVSDKKMTLTEAMIKRLLES